MANLPEKNPHSLRDCVRSYVLEISQLCFARWGQMSIRIFPISLIILSFTRWTQMAIKIHHIIYKNCHFNSLTLIMVKVTEYNNRNGAIWWRILISTNAFFYFTRLIFAGIRLIWTNIMAGCNTVNVNCCYTLEFLEEQKRGHGHTKLRWYKVCPKVWSERTDAGGS